MARKKAITADQAPAFARLLRAAREAAGWPTQAAAAERAGIKANNYCFLETHYVGRGWTMVCNLIVALSLPLEMFFPEQAILDAAERVRRARATGRAAGKGHDGPGAG